MSRYALLTAVLATNVAAHGFIKTITLDGQAYEGFQMWNPSASPDAIGWSFTTPDEGPVLDVSSPDFVCRQGSAPSANHGQIAAGGQVDFFWTSADLERNPDGWDASHRGPVFTYIAPCGGDCSSVDKTALRWTKIAESGLVSGPANTEGVWATDVLRQNGGSHSATIPASIAPGKYVVRSELIALHRAHLSEPEFYAQCGNIEVTGSGSDDLSSSGVVASQLYSTADTQLFGFSVYDGSESSWPIPGPPLYSGAGSAAAPSSEAPAEVPAETPAEVPAETPAEVPAEAPVEVPEETPEEIPEEVPEETVEEAPVWSHPGSWWSRKANNYS
jgi:cellulase